MKTLTLEQTLDLIEILEEEIELVMNSYTMGGDVETLEVHEYKRLMKIKALIEALK